jgi:hypothetical protein
MSLHLERSVCSFLLLVTLTSLGITPAGVAARPGNIPPTAGPVASGLAQVWTVCPVGPPTCDYAVLQEAADAAGTGDTIKVAAGIYDDVHSHAAPPGYQGPGVITQVLYLSRTITLRGGYTVSNGFADPPDPIANPTTLNAQGQGRVLVIAGAISPTVEGFRLTGGNADRLGGRGYSEDVGGGIYLIEATATLRVNAVYSNCAEYGGGAYLYGADPAFYSNTISSNTAAYGGGVYMERGREPTTFDGNTFSANTASGDGGGMYGVRSTATLRGNTISANQAGVGGGMYLYDSIATLAENVVADNLGGGLVLLYSKVALSRSQITGNQGSWGGGLEARWSSTTITENTFALNSASYGGGVSLEQGVALFSGNSVFSNSADYGGGLSSNSAGATIEGNVFTANTASAGGGLYLSYSRILDNDGGELSLAGWGARSEQSSSFAASVPDNIDQTVYGPYAPAMVIGNTITANRAELGGGVHSGSSGATLVANNIAGNVALFHGGGVYSVDDRLGNKLTLIGNTVRENRAAAQGGGLYVRSGKAALSSDVVIDNQAGSGGSGLYLTDSSSSLLHPTIARNGGEGSGVLLTGDGYLGYSVLTMTNAIVVSQTVGITATVGCTATLDGVLWFANGVDTGGTGTVVVSHPFTADPRFAPDGYHIQEGSGALDRGLGGDFPLDVDGDYRPPAAPPDLGADELLAAPPVCRARLNGGGPIYTSLQEAIAASTAPSDTVEAAGLCEDAVPWEWGSTVVVLTRTLTLRGGYSLDFGAWDPAAYPTILNGHLQGSVVVVGPGAGPTVEHLTLLGGASGAGGGLRSTGDQPTLRHLHVAFNAAGFGGGLYLGGLGGQLEASQVEGNLAVQGGGVCAHNAVITLTSDSLVENAAGNGGGVFLYGSVAVFSTSIISANTTACSGGGLYARESTATVTGTRFSGNHSYWGGGLHLRSGEATVRGNTFSGNTAGWGGGLYMLESRVSVQENAVSANTGGNGGGGLLVYESRGTIQENTISGNISGFAGGGGLWVNESTITVTGNTVSANISPASSYYGGGGLWADHSSLAIAGNTVADNIGSGLTIQRGEAAITGNLIAYNIGAWSGGGILLGDSPATVVGNTILANRSNYEGGGLCFGRSTVVSDNTIALNRSRYGGGITAYSGDIALDRNTITANTADEWGGGLYLHLDNTRNTVLTNNIVAGNWAGGAGSGLYVKGPYLSLRHTTIARNRGGDGSGIYVAGDTWNHGTVVLTNTILVGQQVGITVTAGSTATLEATLWGGGVWQNGRDWDGAGTVSTGTINLWGDPAFTTPDMGDYHISTASAARDAGIDTGVTADLDGDARPTGPGYDIGADELWAALRINTRADHSPVRPGTQLVFSIGITNVGLVTLTTTITDVLPAQVTPTGILTWTVTLPVSAENWTRTVAVTVAPAYAGPLVNQVQAATLEGATGHASCTVFVGAAIIYLPLIRR